ncbi:unnamed protein product [Lota lota]
MCSSNAAAATATRFDRSGAPPSNTQSYELLPPPTSSQNEPLHLLLHQPVLMERNPSKGLELNPFSLAAISARQLLLMKSSSCD